jgi:hypothetical protein
MLTLEQYVADLGDWVHVVRVNVLLSFISEQYPEASAASIHRAIKAARRKEC